MYTYARHSLPSVQLKCCGLRWASLCPWCWKGWLQAAVCVGGSSLCPIQSASHFSWQSQTSGLWSNFKVSKLPVLSSNPLGRRCNLLKLSELEKSKKKIIMLAFLKRSFFLSFLGTLAKFEFGTFFQNLICKHHGWIVRLR